MPSIKATSVQLPFTASDLHESRVLPGHHTKAFFFPSVYLLPQLAYFPFLVSEVVEVSTGEMA